MSIQFLDGEGNPVTALDLVTEITVSASRKVGIAGSFGSDDAFQSMKASIPPGLPHETIRGIADDLYEECQIAVAERMAALQPDTQPASASQSTRGSELEEWFDGPAPDEENTDLEPRTSDVKPKAAGNGNGGGRALKFAPKAAERQPGDHWETKVTHYKLKEGELQLWKSTGKFPEVTLYKHNPAFPESWLDKMPKDGEKHEFAKPVVVHQVVGDRKNDKGFYYVNVEKLEVKMAA